MWWIIDWENDIFLFFSLVELLLEFEWKELEAVAAVLNIVVVVLISEWEWSMWMEYRVSNRNISMQVLYETESLSKRMESNYEMRKEWCQK